MKEITRDKAYEISCNKQDKIAERHKKKAEFWWKYIGSPAITRAANRGKIKIRFFIFSDYFYECYDLLHKKGFRIFTDATVIPFISEIEIYWN